MRPSGSGSRTARATRAGARRRRAAFTARTPRRSSRALQRYGEMLPADPFDLEGTEERWATSLRRNPSARAALSSALHDLVGKRLGIPVWKLWGLDPASAPRSTFTIGLDTPEKVKAKVLEAEAVSHPQDQARHRSGRRDPAHHPGRHRQGDPGRCELRLDGEAGHPDAAGAEGIRRDGAGAAAAARPARRHGGDHPEGGDPGHRRRELRDPGRHPAAGRARSTGSTSSWPSAAGSAKRSG